MKKIGLLCVASVHLVTLLALSACGSGMCIKSEKCGGEAKFDASINAAMDFGIRSFGSSTSLLYTLSNTGGFAASGISAATLTSPFSFTGGVFPGTGGTCTNILEAGASCTLAITFDAPPPPYADYTGTLTVQIPLRASSNNGSFNRATGFDRTIQAICATDSALYIGGIFTTFSTHPINRISRLLNDGSFDGTLNVGTGANNSVQAILPFSSTSHYIAGSFTQYNGTSAGNITRIFSDGSVDPSFNTGSGFNGTIISMVAAVDGSGDVYAAGAFTTHNGTSNINRIARLNSDGSRDTFFDTGAAGLNAAANVVRPALDGSQDVYVGGFFTTYRGVSRNRMTRINNDGSIDNGFAVGTGFNGTVADIAIANDLSGDVYVAGVFTQYQGATANYLVRLNNDGTVDTGFAVGTGPSAPGVVAIIPLTDGSGRIIIGGDFTSYQGTTVNRIARINANGTLDTTFVSGTGFDLSIATFAFASDGDLIVGGYFSGYNGTAINRLARLSPNGALRASFGPPSSGFNNWVNAFSPDTRGDIYVGGEFTFYSGTGANGIVRLNSDSTLDTSFAYGSGFNDKVRNLLVNENGASVYIGGIFTSYKGTAANFIARLKADGTIDSAFNPGAGLNGSPWTMEFAPDGSGDIYIGGEFTSYRSTGANYIVRANSDGTIDTGFAYGTGFNNFVWGINAQSSGKIYVAGDFTTYQGSSYNRLVRLNANGTVDTTFVVGTGFNGRVYNVTETTDGSGKLYVFGSFTTYKGATLNYMGRLTSDGTVDATFNTGAGFSDYVWAVTPAPDNTEEIYVAGNFLSYNAVSFPYFLRLTATGTLSTSFSPGIGPTDIVFAAASGDSTTDLYVGGVATAYNGTSIGRIMRLAPNGSID